MKLPCKLFHFELKFITVLEIFRHILQTISIAQTFSTREAKVKVFAFHSTQICHLRDALPIQFLGLY